MYECNDNEVCLGETRSNMSGSHMDVIGQCADGYGGVLCSNCLPGYSMTLGFCTQCLEEPESDDQEDSSSAGVSSYDHPLSLTALVNMSILDTILLGCGQNCLRKKTGV